MIFCGDIALPFVDAVKLVDIPDSIRTKVWFGNLEGSLLSEKETNGLLQKRKVYNDLDAIRDLCEHINFMGLGIANNHIIDVASVRTTKEHLDSIGKACVGAGLNEEEAKEPLVVDDFVIIAFGWEGISCIPAKKKKEGVNRYAKWNVEQQVNHLLGKYPEKKVVCYMHWNYELELYPQPLDRELSHKLIDKGVYAVIGCHSHRVQPIEIYKGRPIVYSLGNFAIRQNTYMGGTLSYPDGSCEEIAFEIKNDGTYRVHRFYYKRNDHILSYLGTAEILETFFSGMNRKKYNLFFKRNRVQKKMLPIFYYEESRLIYFLKLKIVRIRQQVINVLVLNNRLYTFVKKLLKGYNGYEY